MGEKVSERFYGFTLIELVMLIVIIGIIAVIAIPRFIDMRTEAKKAAVAGSLAALRAGIEIQYAVIQARGYESEGEWPTLDEMRNNQIYRGGGAYISPVVQGDIPPNLFDDDGDPNNIADATGATKGEIVDDSGGWAYNPETGEIWANTNVAGENYL